MRVKNMKVIQALWCAGLVAAAVLPGCASSSTRQYVPAAGEATVARFEAMKKLAGRWETAAPPGGQPAVCEFKVIAGGSVLVETMFPGAPHEMINTYSVDGDSIIATHYCAAGNQPRMTLTPGGGTDFAFVSTGVTNLHSATEDCMLDVRIVMDGPDRYKATWRGREKGKIGEHAVFEMTRKK